MSGTIKTLIYTAIGGLVLGAPMAVLAQDGGNAGYAPPTMFEAPPTAQPRPESQGAIIPQIYSPNVDLDDNRDAGPAYVKPRVSRSSNQAPAPVPQPYVPDFQPVPPKPLEQTPVGRQMQAIEQKAVPRASVPTPSAPTQRVIAPVPVPPPPNVAPIQPPQKSTVTGPKTMPAVPAQDVEAEAVFAPPPQAKTMMEKHIERQQVEKLPVPQAPAPAPKKAEKRVAPEKIAVPKAEQAAPMTQDKTLRLLFAAGARAPDEAQLSSINSNILVLMKANPSLQVHIRAFASPLDTSQSSDRRVALSRALAIRSFLIDQGIEARRIDVRALGAQAAQGPADRVDLVLSSAS